MKVRAVGVIGAGKLGVVLAQLALQAGYGVYISASSEPAKIKLTIEVLAPGAIAASNEEVAYEADVVILALPLGKFRQLPPDLFDRKLVIDAMNYWWEVDGPRSDILPDEMSTSVAVQEYFSGARVVKALSHMGYHDLHDESKSSGAAGRKAIAIAGDDSGELEVVRTLVDNLGFDPVHIGSLAEGRRLEPGSPVFGANVGREALLGLLGSVQSDGQLLAYPEKS